MSSQISKDEKADSDKFLLDYSRRRHSGSGSNAPAGQTEISREDMVLKNMHGELEKGMKNIVGPAFLGCGIYGFFAGIFQTARSTPIKNRPMKLVLTSLINTVGKQSSFYANTGASLGLVYCLTRKTINFIFEEDLQELTDIQLQFIYGFASGALFKSTRGFQPALLTGILVAGLTSGMCYVNKKYQLI